MAATDEIRSLFPALSRKVYGKNLVYFDNAATVQRPQSVIDCWNRITRDSNANIHRAVHLLAEEATDAYESARDAVRNFINASSREEVIFTPEPLLPSISWPFLSARLLSVRETKS